MRGSDSAFVPQRQTRLINYNVQSGGFTILNVGTKIRKNLNYFIVSNLSIVIHYEAVKTILRSRICFLNWVGILKHTYTFSNIWLLLFCKEIVSKFFSGKYLQIVTPFNSCHSIDILQIAATIVMPAFSHFHPCLGSI